MLCMHSKAHQSFSPNLNAIQGMFFILNLLCHKIVMGLNSSSAEIMNRVMDFEMISRSPQRRFIILYILSSGQVLCQSLQGLIPNGCCYGEESWLQGWYQFQSEVCWNVQYVVMRLESKELSVSELKTSWASGSPWWLGCKELQLH